MEVVKAFNLEEKLSADFAHQVGGNGGEGETDCGEARFPFGRIPQPVLPTVHSAHGYRPVCSLPGGVFTAGRMLAICQPSKQPDLPPRAPAQPLGQLQSCLRQPGAGLRDSRLWSQSGRLANI